MALIILTGVPGTGKTLMAIQRYIVPELKRGGVVYTNIDNIIATRLAVYFEFDVFLAEQNLKNLVNPDYFYKELPQNAMCVIDESQNLFNNRDWNTSTNKDCIAYLNQHRHFGHKLIFITPNADMLDGNIRRITEFTYKNKSFSALGSSKIVRCAIFDQCNLSKTPVQIFSWKHDPRIYECYSSYFNKGTTEKKIRVNPFKNATLFFIIVVVAISLYIGIGNSKKFYSHMNKKSANNEIKETQVVKYHSANVIKINDSIINPDAIRAR